MDCLQPGSSGIRILSRNDLWSIMERSDAKTFNEKLKFMELELLSRYSENDPSIAVVKQKLSIVRHEFKQKWSKAKNTKLRFLEHNSEWLNGTISLRKAGLSPGRPQKMFSELTECSKRRKTKDLRSSDLKELAYATQMKLRKTGEVEASKIVKALTRSPRRAKKYATAIKKSTVEEDKQAASTKLIHLRALFMYTEAGLTQAQYKVVRDTNPGFYPCYSILQKLKKECYPEIHRITETCAEVRVQSLMDHTTKRLLLHLGDEVMEQLTLEEKQSFVLISKWGCDGSQQMQYKMKFENETDSDANLFQSSVVPLQLVFGIDRKIMWQNPTPSSPRYCRPIRLRFIKETTDVTNDEIHYIENQIEELDETKIDDISVKHKMVFTMVDGKVCNAATKSTMKCYICGATSAQFNDLTKERQSHQRNF